MLYQGSPSITGDASPVVQTPINTAELTIIKALHGIGSVGPFKNLVWWAVLQ